MSAIQWLKHSKAIYVAFIVIKFTIWTVRDQLVKKSVLITPEMYQ